MTPNAMTTLQENSYVSVFDYFLSRLYKTNVPMEQACKVMSVLEGKVSPLLAKLQVGNWKFTTVYVSS